MQRLNTLLTFLLISLLSLTFSFNLNANSLGNALDNWQTFETENFRVHFTPSFKDWAISSAHQMEKVRTLLIAQQGRALDEKVDAYIIDPYNSANGFAVPLSEKPYMALYVTPPSSDSFGANLANWQQMLILHEYTHLVHLGQKSRSSFTQGLRRYWDNYDVKNSMQPRWVSEGYATLLESKLTGQGRLYDHYIDATLEQFARTGSLPTYEQLNGGSGYLSGSMAYYVGSRYLDWLIKNFGEENLDAVWTRKNAVRHRGFEQAFKGAFGYSAKTLYKRFVAEFTYHAITKEQQASNSQSTLWADIKTDINSPALSPDSKKLVYVNNTKRGKKFLTIVSTENNIKAEEAFDKRQQNLIKYDPQDIADVKPLVFERRLLHTLPQQNFKGLSNPRWLDNNTIIYGALNQHSNGRLNQDLFVWHLDTDSTYQLTYQQFLRRFDISADKSFLIAEQNKNGFSSLVKVKLQHQKLDSSYHISATETTELTTPSLAVLYDFPRISSNGEKIAYLKRPLNHKWQLHIEPLEKNTLALGSKLEINTVVAMPQNYQFVSFPEWDKANNTLYFVASDSNNLKIYQYQVTQSKLTAISNGLVLPAWPMSVNKNQLLHFSIKSDGPDIMQLAVNNANSKAVHATTSKTSLSRLKSKKVTAKPIPLNSETKAQTIMKHSLATDNSLKKHHDFGKTMASNTNVQPNKVINHPVIEPAEINLDTELGEQTSYGIGQQETTMVANFLFNNTSTHLFEIAIKQSDLLNRFKWQLNASGDFSDKALTGFSGNMSYKSHWANLTLHGYNATLKIDEQRGTSAITGNSDEIGLVISADRHWMFNYAKLGAVAELHHEESYLSKNDYLYLEANQTWFIDRQTWGLTEKASAAYLKGKLAGNGSTVAADSHWQGYDLNISLQGYYHWLSLGIDATKSYRDNPEDQMFSLGGFSSNLISQQAHRNKILVPALPFYLSTGNKYQKVEGFIPVGPGKLFIAKHEMEGSKDVEVFGMSVKNTSGNMFTGVNGLTFEAGLVGVTPKHEKTETKFWLSSYYQW